MDSQSCLPGHVYTIIPMYCDTRNLFRGSILSFDLLGHFLWEYGRGHHEHPTKKLAHLMNLPGQPLTPNHVFEIFRGEPPPPPHKLKGKYNELRYIRIIFETNANFYAQNRSDIKLLTKLKIDKFAKVPTLFNKIQEYSNKSHY